jgi:Zn-dependent peptidase ImmA (M78 family)
MERLCAQAGVAVVFVREIPGSGISGATRWLSAEKAMVLLSLRYKRDDQLWFTFFHEVGHILLHGKKAVFLEGEGQSDKDEKEREADRFAADILIPPKDAAQLPYLGSKAAIVEFAKSVGVSPGIVAGRWQHETQQYSRFQDLKRKLEWAPSGK